MAGLHERPPVGSAPAEADVHTPAQAGAVKCGILRCCGFLCTTQNSNNNNNKKDASSVHFGRRPR